MIGIVDYGGGNVHSVQRALEAVVGEGGVVERISDPDRLRHCDRVVFPGQGAMHDCTQRLQESGLHDALVEAFRSKPFLGICVGLQMLFESSEEAHNGQPTRGLGMLPGQVVRMTPERGILDTQGHALKVPHMGWNEISPMRTHPILAGLGDHPLGLWFYFVHSYYAQPANMSDLLATTDYGQPLAVAVARDNLVATQFHPEKSAGAGLRLLSNFVAWSP